MTWNTVNMSEIDGKTHFVFKCSECLQIIQQFKQQETSLDQVQTQTQACHAPPLSQFCLTLHDVARQDWTEDLSHTDLCLLSPLKSSAAPQSPVSVLCGVIRGFQAVIWRSCWEENICKHLVWRQETLSLSITYSSNNPACRAWLQYRA